MGKALVDGGTPLVNGMHFTKDDVSHGKTEITGYSIVQAENWEDLKELIVDHPHYMVPNSGLEVFEMMPMMWEYLDYLWVFSYSFLFFWGLSKKLNVNHLE